MKKQLLNSKLLSLLTVMISFSILCNHLHAQVSETDRNILLELYNSTDGDSWTNKTNWGTTEDVSTWYGVTVVADEIIEIDLNKNNLEGIIPASLGQLASLQYLKLDTNKISGSIPVELGNLSALQQLYLGGNQLNGSIPEELANLTNLIWLNLSDNLLTGAIPSGLDQLDQLEYLQLSLNNLSGSIPAELADLTNLKWLNLGENQLTGTIPAELGLLSDIEQLYLNGNQLSGSIPTQLGNLTAMKWMNLGQNQLTGGIPVELGGMTNLSLLYLDENLLTGSIPLELGQISTLEWLNLSENQLSGNIPDEIWQLTNLKLIYLNENQLTGSIPSDLSQITELLWVHLNSNKFSSIPDITAPASLEELFVYNNQLAFDHIEFNMDLLTNVNFIYAPQDSIGTTETLTKSEGEAFNYILTTGGTQNQYKWYKDGVLLPLQTTETLNINNLTVADAGNYYCEVTNTAVPGLTLTSRQITLLLNICYTRNFSAGWNIFSSPVMPTDPNMQNIFQPLIISESLIKIQDETGGSLEKISGNLNNNIGNMALTEGYKVKVSGDDNEIEICGPTVKYPYAIPLKLGWNIIGYPQTKDFDGKDVVQELIDKGVLIKVQDETGSSIEKLSDNWINNIGNFVKGEGYKVKVNATDTLWIYNNYPHIKSNSIQSELIPTAYFRPAFTGNGVDHMNIYLARPDESGIMEGDEIGIFDGNICVGATKITKQNSSYISLIASAADGTGDKANGFRNGGDIILKLYRNGKEYSMSLQPANNSSLRFVKNGTVIATTNTDFTTGIETQENETNVNCYPNPFYENINIEINLQKEEILSVEIFDLYSRKIQQLYNSRANGNIKLQWDGNDERGNKVATGVYLLRVNKTWKKVMYSGK
jgi:Leucine-rich repeat (LRR) protein